MKLKNLKKILIFFISLFIILSLFSVVVISFLSKLNNQSENDDVYENLDLSQYTEYGEFGDEEVIWVKKENYTGIQYGVINKKGEFVVPLTSEIVDVHRMAFMNGFSIAYMYSSERASKKESDPTINENFAVIYNSMGQIVYRFEHTIHSDYSFLNNGNIYLKNVAPYGSEGYCQDAFMLCAGSGRIVEMPMDNFRDSIGMYSDGLLCLNSGSLTSKDIRYFDAEGNCVLYLNETNEYYKHIVSASDFNNGIATIVFKGFDDNAYRVEIDKTGKWLTEPEITYEY